MPEVALKLGANSRPVINFFLIYKPIRQIEDFNPESSKRRETVERLDNF
jgi:hypothetical protein